MVMVALTGVTPSGAIEGISVINQNGILLGSAGSISSLSFEGSGGVTVTGTTGGAGIATVVISATSLAVLMGRFNIIILVISEFTGIATLL